VVCAGCGSKPRAPALSDDPVYQNAQEGFRFLPPEGWQMRSRAEVHPDKLSREMQLVEYKRFTHEKPASFTVSMDDISPARGLADCLQERKIAPGTWRLHAPVESLTVSGLKAARAVFRATVDGEPTVTEIVAVRRGERVYFFTGVYPEDDARAREQVRKAVASAAW
jgi:hypothetical protein